MRKVNQRTISIEIREYKCCQEDRNPCKTTTIFKVMQMLLTSESIAILDN